MFDDTILLKARELISSFTAKGLKVATAESCTGGLIIGSLTEISGSSAVVDRGFVTYSNEAKAELINVPMDLIIEYGAVSEQVARAMVDGALDNSNADIAVAVTGIAGPGGGSVEKPTGLVHFSAKRRGHNTLHERIVFGDTGRSQVRTKTVLHALNMMIAQADLP